MVIQVMMSDDPIPLSYAKATAEDFRPSRFAQISIVAFVLGIVAIGLALVSAKVISQPGAMYVLISAECCFTAGVCFSCMALILRKDRSVAAILSLIFNGAAGLLLGSFLIFMLFFFGIPAQQ